MLTYYPPIKPYAEHKLSVSKIHTIYVEECGNPKGLPILLVHGGPGAGCSEDSRRYFDPTLFRIVLFDQRGAGRSTPHAELAENNTQALVGDIETIREFLDIEQWILFGGSWGSTLSLVYAQTYPTRVKHMILRGIFLARKQDEEWIFGGKGANYIFPDHWAEFLQIIPPHYHGDVAKYYDEVLNGADELAQMAAAKAWSKWEGYCATLEPNPQKVEALSNPYTAISLAKLECHYGVNKFFLKSNQILNDMHLIQHIPSIIVHGRYDIVCPMDNAWQLHKAWTNSELIIVPAAGHAGSEPGILSALIHATRRVSRLY